MAEFFTPHTRDPQTESRHRARYHFVGSFCRAGMKVLDVPCGSGYGAEVLSGLSIQYRGLDRNVDAVRYAKEHFAGTFELADLTQPPPLTGLDLTACVEGLEHFTKDQQTRFVPWLASTIQPKGLVILTTPLSNGPSGPNPKNPHHLHEMSPRDLLDLMQASFENLQVVTMTDVLSTGDEHVTFYLACRNPKIT